MSTALAETTVPTMSPERAALWEERVRRHNHRVVVALLAMGLRIDRAREIAQAAWVRLILKDESGGLEHIDLPQLAIAQARYLALDALRQDRREQRIMATVDEPTQLEVPDGARSAESRLMSREDLLLALETLSACPESAQRVFRLAYEDPSRPHAEIAEEVGLSLQRVRQILCEVRKKLRTALEGGAS